MNPDIAHIVEDLTQPAPPLESVPSLNFSTEQQMIHALRDYYREFYIDGHCDCSFMFWIRDHLQKPLH